MREEDPMSTPEPAGARPPGQARITRRQLIGRTLTAAGALSVVGGDLPGVPGARAYAAGPNNTQQLIIAGAKDVINLDPVQENDSDSTYVVGLIHDTVAVLDRSLNVKPNLAQTWSASKDGLTYTYRFRRDVRFHDGSTLTADDVVFTIDRILANKYPAGRKKEKVEMIESYRKLDASTIEIKLKFPYAPFAAAFGAQAIVPKAAVEKMGDAEYGRRPVGCGPFKFVEWVPNDHVTLEGFADYWLVKPKLRTLIIRPIPENSVAVADLLSGGVDVITDIVGPNLQQVRAAAARGIQVLNRPGLYYFFAGFRMLKPPFTDLRFRQAVYLSTDFDATIRAIFPPEIGSRAYDPVPPGLWPQDQQYLQSIALKQDKARAKALFQQLVNEGVMPRDYPVTIAPPPDDARIKIAEVMVTNLREIGVNAVMERVEWATYTTVVEGGNENLVFMLGTIPAVPDPDANVRWLFGKDGAHGQYLNIAQFKEDAAWDAQINQAQVSQDKATRTRLYREIVRTMMKEVIHIPLYYKNAIMAKRADVKDLDVSVLWEWDIVKPWANVYVDRTR